MTVDKLRENIERAKQENVNYAEGAEAARVGYVAGTGFLLQVLETFKTAKEQLLSARQQFSNTQSGGTTAVHHVGNVRDALRDAGASHSNNEEVRQVGQIMDPLVDSAKTIPKSGENLVNNVDNMVAALGRIASDLEDQLLPQMKAAAPVVYAHATQNPASIASALDTWNP